MATIDKVTLTWMVKEILKDRLQVSIYSEGPDRVEVQLLWDNGSGNLEEIDIDKG